MSHSKTALGVLELTSIARGIATVDALLKRAQVDVIASRPVSGAYFLIVLRGGIAEMEESMSIGQERANPYLRDSTMIPLLDETLWKMIPDPYSSQWDSHDVAAAIVETETVSATIDGADVACKSTDVEIRDMRLAVGIAGKAFFTITGRHTDVEAAIEQVKDQLQERLFAVEIIASPAAELVGRLIS